MRRRPPLLSVKLRPHRTSYLPGVYSECILSGMSLLPVGTLTGIEP
jgi:hypothetical protein